MIKVQIAIIYTGTVSTTEITITAITIEFRIAGIMGRDHVVVEGEGKGTGIGIGIGTGIGT